MEREQLIQQLQDIRQGRLPESELYSTIHGFGRQHFLEARQDVERLLKHSDPQIRKIALHVLTKDWRLSEHWETAHSFLLHDPDIDCRMQGASALGTLKMNTQDHRTLSVLAKVVTNQQEVPIVRETAYAAMRGILHFDPREQFRLASKGIATQEMDWNMVQSYL